MKQKLSMGFIEPETVEFWTVFEIPIAVNCGILPFTGIEYNEHSKHPIKIFGMLKLDAIFIKRDTFDRILFCNINTLYIPIGIFIEIISNFTAIP